MPRSPTPTGHGPSPSLKQLLKSADILLKPPKPLPSNPPDLLPRLRASSKALPKEWRRSVPEWTEDDEMNHVGDDGGRGIDEERKKRRRDDLVHVVGKRCFAMIKAMQLWLEKEAWPKDQRDGLEDRDFLLGTGDLRLIRLMLSHTTFSYLLPLATTYADALPMVDHNVAASLASALEAILKLLKTTAPPAPAAGPSSRLPIAPTAITQSLLSSHLIPIFLSTLILAYTPSIPADHHASLRLAFLQALMSLTPGHAISSLVNVLKLLVQGRKADQSKTTGWVREWPKYPEGIINGLLTAQVRRPGGVRGLMENVLGDTARTDDVTSIEGKRLDHIFNVLVRIPRQVTPEIYYPWLLSELFSMIPLDDSSSHHPIAYVNTACYCIQRLWRSNTSIGDWLKNKLHSPWYPKIPAASGTPVEVTSWQAIQRSVQNTRLLLIHNPASPDFVDFLVGSILSPLFSLHSFLSLSPAPSLIRPVSTRAVRQTLPDDVSFLLTSWGKTVDKDMGVKGLWGIVDAGKGWKVGEDGVRPDFFWERVGDGVRLMSGSQQKSLSEPEIVLPSLSNPSDSDTPSDDDVERMTQRLLAESSSSIPDPTLLCKLIKDIDRPEVACQVILKALHVWRIRALIDSEPPIKAMLHLQLTMELMTHLGAELFTEPEQLLEWIEQTLADQADRLEQEDQEEEEEEGGAKSLIQEVKSIEQKKGRTEKEDDAADGNRGLIELACQLLASQEVKAAVSQKSLPILLPIVAHLDLISKLSPSSSTRSLAHEASLLLLSHQTTIPSSAITQKSVKETIDKALELVQDSTVPVRAHGLSMLQDVVFDPAYDTAYTPLILNTFMTHIEDDDSFVYLSAVKGLSSMVDALGGEVFSALMAAYEVMAKRLKKLTDADDIDKMLRLAEAVDQVIEKTGDALGIYADRIIPILMAIFPDTNLATAIRSSALSLLTTCAKASYFSLLPWATDLTNAAIDLIQLESVAVSPFKPGPLHTAAPPPPSWKNPLAGGRKVQLVEDEPALSADGLSMSAGEEEQQRKVADPWIEDAEPIAINDSKHPLLRRAAISFLNWIFSVVTFKVMSDHHDTAADPIFPSASDISLTPVSHNEIMFKEPLDPTMDADLQVGAISHKLLERAATVLGYVQHTDVDELSRGHAESAERMLGMLRAAVVISQGGDVEGSGLEDLSESLEGLKVSLYS
ncbi:hypothetical protein B9479_003635 [Cryptococcus floricola]|uniref:RNA polymerase II assembly factor Rtp1 C-terminal domain-containing protein n=1 Tax=Cryptococcus floricola TaxID=2591691 RepID=A0A5D3AWD1_9TREE|nr:hypothetical protein B9479_003635 [Cryptococcus floricola]